MAMVTASTFGINIHHAHSAQVQTTNSLPGIRWTYLSKVLAVLALPSDVDIDDLFFDNLLDIQWHLQNRRTSLTHGFLL